MSASPQGALQTTVFTSWGMLWLWQGYARFAEHVVFSFVGPNHTVIFTGCISPRGREGPESADPGIDVWILTMRIGHIDTWRGALQSNRLQANRGQKTLLSLVLFQTAVRCFSGLLASFVPFSDRWHERKASLQHRRDEH